MLFHLSKVPHNLSSQNIDDLDNPRHKYYLKVCYICKETTTKEHCIHYGALACFSCRAFFRRSHQGMQDKGLTNDGKRKLPEFTCKKSGKCNVTPKTRRRCQKCRYDLCIKAGMMPHAVMTEDQVKVRFRKMFTKRSQSQNNEPGNNETSTEYGTEDPGDQILETYDQQESGQSLTLYPTRFERVSFEETEGRKEPEVDQNVPQEYNNSLSTGAMSFLNDNRKHTETRLLPQSRTQIRATSAPPSDFNVKEGDLFSSNGNYQNNSYSAREILNTPFNDFDGSSAFQTMSKKQIELGKR